MLKTTNILLFVFLLFSNLLWAQVKIPKVYSNIKINDNNDMVLELDSSQIIVKTIDAVYKVDDFDKVRKLCSPIH